MIKWISACLCTPWFSVKLNGIIHDYFHGTKGIWLGDPMSPYIYALCMNILTRTLNKAPGNFKYHWKCNELLLSHLFFCRWCAFLCTRFQALGFTYYGQYYFSFQNWSGLTPSLHNSTSFLCKCNPELTSWFDDTFSIPRGSFPMRFLGVPHISSQLCISDCMLLINK